jgi:DNA-binding CsgD family transcriptional regulator
MRERLSLLPRRLGLIRAVLACSGFFLIGIILDLLEEIPQTSVSVSIIGVDFYPLYLLGIGFVVAFWALRDLRNPTVGTVTYAGAGTWAGAGNGTFAGVGSDRFGARLSASKPGARVPDLSRLPVIKREREIIGLILLGETNMAIADRLFISESTVKKHINNLFRKFSVTSRWELLKLTRESGG